MRAGQKVVIAVQVVVADDDLLLREGLASDDHRRVLAVITFLEAR